MVTFFPGISRADYEALSGLNWSSLRPILDSPRAYQRSRMVPREDTAAMRLGRLAHLYILQPELADNGVAIFSGTRRGKAWDEFRAANRGREIVSDDEDDAATCMAAAVSEHDEASALLCGGEAELSLTWDADGRPCKGRADYWHGATSVLVDLKTSRDITPRSMAATAARLHYHAQLAWYADAVQAQRVYVVAVQSVEPYDVAVYDMDPWMAAGRAQYRRALELLRDCERADKWPGMAPDVVALDMPPWAGVADADDPLAGYLD